jgi:hypothetical protein
MLRLHSGQDDHGRMAAVIQRVGCRILAGHNDRSRHGMPPLSIVVACFCAKCKMRYNRRERNTRRLKRHEREIFEATNRMKLGGFCRVKTASSSPAPHPAAAACNVAHPPAHPALPVASPSIHVAHTQLNGVVAGGPVILHGRQPDSWTLPCLSDTFCRWVSLGLFLAPSAKDSVLY